MDDGMVWRTLDKRQLSWKKNGERQTCRVFLQKQSEREGSEGERERKKVRQRWGVLWREVGIYVWCCRAQRDASQPSLIQRGASGRLKDRWWNKELKNCSISLSSASGAKNKFPEQHEIIYRTNLSKYTNLAPKFILGLIFSETTNRLW